MTTTADRPVVFLGPSMPLADAETIVAADYRPPIRRGDLDDITPGTVVAIIDGVFDQNLAVSPREVLNALGHGVTVFGGGSMGALRAAEVPGVIGIGQVYAWYRDRVITRDDEVALLFNPETYEALTVPTVNVRFAVERRARPGTIDQKTARSLLHAATEIPFSCRTYRAIVERAGLSGRSDVADLIQMLEAQDLKYRDAQAVLEAIDCHRNRQDVPGAADDPGGCWTRPSETDAAIAPVRGFDEVLIWESGDRISHEELLTFLCFTGKLKRYAAAALARSGLPRATPSPGPPCEAPQQLLTDAARRWGWVSAEEARVTLADLGFDLKNLDDYCVNAAEADASMAHAFRENSRKWRQALCAELFLDDLSLKREVMRLGSLRYLASRSQGPVTPQQVQEAKSVLCKANRTFDFSSAQARWAELGWSSAPVQDQFVEMLARARHAARRFRAALADSTPGCLDRNLIPFIAPSPKPPSEPRFSTPAETAARHAERLARRIGVSRVGMIGELADLGGIQIAQAARPGGAWSSSYGSGKSLSSAGAVTGCIMEELEKWAQEQFDPPEDTLVRAAYRDVETDQRFVPPHTLDLPYDSVYDQAAPLWWCPGVNLLTGRPAFVPLDVVHIRHGRHDICYTNRGSRKHLATNGLGSGFSLAEAVLHAICEYVERHAQRISEILLVNPGGLGPHNYRLLDLETTSAEVRDLARRLAGKDEETVRVLDITCEVAIPTFVANLTRDRQRADGFGTHPNALVAVEMALLEAAQTVASAVAGGREDLSIRARSLGRHERPRPTDAGDAWFWMDPDSLYQPLADTGGFVSADIRDDVAWALGRLREAGLPYVVMIDLTAPGISPAHVVRVLIPGLETNNPFYTGPRARCTLLRDLLPDITARHRGRTA